MPQVARPRGVGGGSEGLVLRRPVEVLHAATGVNHLDVLRVAVEDFVARVGHLPSHAAQVQLAVPHARPLALEPLACHRPVAVGEDHLGVRMAAEDVVDDARPIVAREELPAEPRECRQLHAAPSLVEGGAEGHFVEPVDGVAAVEQQAERAAPEGRLPHRSVAGVSVHIGDDENRVLLRAWPAVVVAEGDAVGTPRIHGLERFAVRHERRSWGGAKREHPFVRGDGLMVQQRMPREGVEQGEDHDPEAQQASE
mmetsp:Transcript_48949/g.86473  ORF Transcript_48949/g.86473 Transcript_48949/m.86473 type:complete len:254 (-) Transcript_48949:87-848(-)